jgi:hypothetical protein
MARAIAETHFSDQLQRESQLVRCNAQGSHRPLMKKMLLVMEKKGKSA